MADTYDSINDMPTKDTLSTDDVAAIVKWVWLHKKFKCPSVNTTQWSAEYTRWAYYRAGLAKSKKQACAAVTRLAATEVVDVLGQFAKQSENACPEDCDTHIEWPLDVKIETSYSQPTWRTLWTGIYCTVRLTASLTVTCEPTPPVRVPREREG
jgi:hypothetical protein